MSERLPGGNAAGAIRIGDTVRREAGPWTPTIHALLHHLETKGFQGVPRAMGVDEEGREVLSYLHGDTVGDRLPWPTWTHDDATLEQVGRWLRSYHDAVADFVPPIGATWRFGGSWEAGLIIANNDAAPYNAVWHDGLVGFIDWDLAAPASRAWDLAFVAFSWVPLVARSVATREGFEDFDARPTRLRRLLAAYGYEADQTAFVDLVRQRARASADGIRSLAAAGDALCIRLLQQGVANDVDRAVDELGSFEL
ncbi:MAG TPA: aminoglycoside phosphotransferase family protein [Actinomycetota bacterium]|nr:aminoglycoside phosphotransferase family protein [Actinomycetota bacterium]